MKVLFVRSGNNGPDPITQNQGDSLIDLGIEVTYFDIIGKGIIGYLNNIFKLHKTQKKLNPDIIHTHYSLSGIITVLSFTGKPIIASLMGSDINNSGKIKLFIIKIFIKYLWKVTIVKSQAMNTKLSLNNIQVVSNGVNLKRFVNISQQVALNKLNWEKNDIHILFGASPDRPEKNFKLAEDALQILKDEFPNIRLHFLTGINREEVYVHYNAAHLLLLTSFNEGSPNVIKEAMACGCPIVVTPVGDVEVLINNTPGCFITSYYPQDVSEKIRSAILFNSRTNGRSHIEHYSANLVAEKILNIYKSAL
jgi:teichuronic acid biosynthesis glycosyltransferase TuaC